MIKISIRTKDGRKIWIVELSTMFYKTLTKEKMRNFLLEECKSVFKYSFNSYIDKYGKEMLEEYGIPFNEDEIDYNKFDYVVMNPEVIIFEYRNALSGNLND